MKTRFLLFMLCTSMLILSTSCDQNECQCDYYNTRIEYEADIKILTSNYQNGIISSHYYEAQLNKIQKDIDAHAKSCNVMTSLSTHDGLIYYKCK